MKIPEAENTITHLIDQHHESQAEPPRPRMGCSTLGEPCERKLWLNFRWAVQEKFPGRILRIFRRGQNEEATVISDLRAIGMDVRTGKQQERVDFGSHVSGSLDGIIEGGVPEAPKKRHILEIKTHSKKSFDDLEKNGVEKSKPMHWVQMMTYMHGKKIDRALYVAICKDDDRIHTERVRYDKEVAEKYIERGRRIALSDRMPEPISADPSWYQCKMCPAYGIVCHRENDWSKHLHVNCRTCAHATPKEDSTWRCEYHDAEDIPVEFQRQGCEGHVLHPDLVPWKVKEGPDRWMAIYEIEGRDVANGEGDAHVYTSREILANPKMCSLGDEYVEELRATFDARIAG